MKQVTRTLTASAVLIGLAATAVLTLSSAPRISVASAAAVAPSQPDPSGLLRSAVERTRASTSYRYSADVDQTLIPRASAATIGQRTQYFNLRLEADIESPTKSTLRMWSVDEAGGGPPITLIRDGDRLYVQRPDEFEPRLVESDLNALSATQDPLEYLLGAEDVRIEAGDKPLAPGYTRFVYAVNGEKLGREMRARAARQGASVGGVPDAYLNLFGTGELWVDANGLIRRQVVDLHLPGASREFDAQISYRMDVRDYGQPAAARAPWSEGAALWSGDPSSGVAEQTSSVTLPYRPSPAPALLVVSLVMALAVARFGRRRGAQRAISLTLAVMLGLTPFLQGAVALAGGPATNRLPTLNEVLNPRADLDKETQQSVESIVRDGQAQISAGAYNRAQTNVPTAAFATANSTNTILACGEGTAGADTDGDGLTDQQEACLGTDPYRADSDDDQISDGVEVNGFEYGGKRWNSNPLNADSSGSGIPDTQKYPQSVSPSSRLTGYDLTGDGTPNIWKTDQDGDGVPDDLDESPFAKSGYLDELTIKVTSALTDAHQYIDLQVQPQDMASMRYSQSLLDWPHDDAGQMLDLNDSTNDLTLVPYLDLRSAVRPFQLAGKYGWTVASERDDNGEYRVLLPLGTINRAGAFYAFATKVAYAPGEIPAGGVTLRGKLVWLVQAQVDKAVNCTRNGCATETKGQLLQTYSGGPFRLTGANVSRSLKYEAAVFGTPQRPNDDAQLFMMIFALRRFFFNYQRFEDQPESNTAIQQLALRFSQPNTPAELRFGLPQTFTVPVSRTVFAHRDEGVFTLSGTGVPNYLNAFYPSATPDKLCKDGKNTTFQCAGLGIITEDTGSTVGLLDAAQNGSTFTFNPAEAVVVTTRGLKMSMFEKLASGKWQTVSQLRTLEIVSKRYLDQMDSLLAVINANRAGAQFDTRSAYYAAFLPYLAYTPGQAEPVAFMDSWNIATEPDSEHLSLLGAFNIAGNTSTTLVQSILDVQEAFTAGVQQTTNNNTNTPNTGNNNGGNTGGNTGNTNNGGANNGNNTNGNTNNQTTNTNNNTNNNNTNNTPPNTNVGQTPPKVNNWQKLSNFFDSPGFKRGFGITKIVMFSATIIAGVATMICTKTKSCSETALKVVSYVILSINAAIQLVDVAVAVAKIAAAGVARATATAVSKMAVALAFVAFGIALLFAWLQFGFSMAAAKGNPIIIKLAIANVIVNTIYAVIQLVINLLALVFPVAVLIAAILAVIDTILAVATGGKWSVAVIILKLFYDIKVPATLKSADFLDSRTALADELAGYTVGNVIKFLSTFRSIVEGSDFDDNFGVGYYNILRSDIRGLNYSNPKSCVTSNNKKQQTCTNDMRAEFALTAPRINATMNFQALFAYRYTYKEVGLFGAITYKTHKETKTLPEPEDRVTSTVTIDVLPATVGGLWSWSALKNPDLDGDGLTNAQEAKLGTNPNNWDTDGDGMSDGFEVNEASTNPLKADSDGDGLTDLQDLSAGTNPLLADSDEDGLTDGEEVFHKTTGGEWVGGWMVNLPGGLQTRIYSLPNFADIDGDSVLDLSERANNLSPFAFNGEPVLSLYGTPYGIAPDSSRYGVVLPPGGVFTLSLTLFSIGNSPITTPLSLCVPSLGINVQNTTMTGARNVTPAVGACAGGTSFTYDFSGANTLEIGALVSATINGVINPAVTTSTAAIAAAVLPHGNKTFSNTVRLIADLDDPSVAIAAPADGEIIQRPGPSSVYIVGGSASDPTSWVNTVEFSAGGAYTLANDINPWSYAWTLPADGVYTLRARATDQVGRATLSDPVQVTVDGTPPAASTAISNGTYLRLEAGDTVTLTGTASDNLAGLARIELSIDRRPYVVVYSAPPGAQVLSQPWSFAWTLPNDDTAHGTHTIAIRAVDRATNRSTPQVTTLIVDKLPPASDLNTNIYLREPQIAGGVPITLYGRASDNGYAPLPVNPATLEGSVAAFDKATVWLGFGKFSDANGGVSVKWLGDVNGDGRADLAVGMPAAEDGRGRVAVVYGKGGDFRVPPDSEALFDARTSFIGDPGAGLGSMIAPAGDLNGDGLWDLLVGDPARNRFFIVFSKPFPFGRDLSLDRNMSEFVSVTVPSGLQALAPAGDVNGDRFGDLLVATADGKVRLMLGRSEPWNGGQSIASEAAAVFDTGGVANPAGMTGAGDVDGDGYADMLIPTPSALHLVRGSGAFAARSAQAIALPGGAAASFTSDASPRAAAVGDVNGDIRADFLVSNGSAPYLVLGRASGPWSADVTFTGYAQTLSGPLTAVGDVDADGRDDFAIGAADGSVFLFRGAASLGAHPFEQAILTQVAALASTPYAAGSDLNCDASSDLLIVSSAAPPEAAPGLDAGANDDAPAPLPLPNLLDTGLTYGILPAGPGGKNVFVDDDYCNGCPNDGLAWDVNAFNSIQTALNKYNDNTMVYVMPGTYSAFAFNWPGQHVSGVNADAVFIDASGGPVAVDANGKNPAAVSNLTLRNATDGARALNGARLTLDRVLMRNLTRYAVHADRLSYVTVNNSTLVAALGANSVISVTGSPDPAFGGATWTQKANIPVGLQSNAALVASGGSLYALPGGDKANGLANHRDLYQYDAGGNSWSQRASLPQDLGALMGAATTGNGNLYAVTRPPNLGSGLNVTGEIRAIVTDPSGNVYVGGSFTSIDGVAATNIAKWTAATQTWSALATGLNEGAGASGVAYFRVSALVLDGTSLYVGGRFCTAGGISNAGGFARWDTVNNTWAVIATPWGSGNCTNDEVRALEKDGTTIHMGGQFEEDWPLPPDPSYTSGGGTTICFTFGSMPRGKVILYEADTSCDYRELGPGDYWSLGDFINKASQVYVPPGLEVTLYNDPGYANGHSRFDSSNCSGKCSLNGTTVGNNRADSAMVRLVSHVKNYAMYVPLNNAFPTLLGETWDYPAWCGLNDSNWRTSVVVFEGENGGGNCLFYGASTTINNFADVGFPGGGNWNDKISSWYVGPEVQLITCGNSNLGGTCETYFYLQCATETPDGICNARTKDPGNDSISSLRVTGAGSGITWGKSSHIKGLDGPVNAIRCVPGTVAFTTDCLIGGEFGGANSAASVPDGSGLRLAAIASSLAPSNNRGRVLASVNSGVNAAVRAIEADGSTFYVGGDFTSPANRVTRLTLGAASRGERYPRASVSYTGIGSVDNGAVYSIKRLPDASMYVGGTFDTVNGGWFRRGLARISGGSLQGVTSNNGELDTANVLAVGYDRNNNVIAGGGFGSAGPTTQRGLGLFYPTYNVWSPPAFSHNYNGGGNAWSSAAIGAVGYNVSRLAMTGDDSGSVYALTVGPATSQLYNISPGSHSWSVAPNSSITGVGSGAALAVSYGTVYALLGGGGNDFSSWTQFGGWNASPADPPFSPSTVAPGASLAWDGNNYIYATVGGGGNGFSAYRLSQNAWDPPVYAPGTTAVAQNFGAGLARAGTVLYDAAGGGNRFDSLDINFSPRPVKLTMNNVAMVAPSGAGTVPWLNLSASTPYTDYAISAYNTVGVDGSWSPNVSTTLTRPQANFYSELNGIYRTKWPTSLGSGYYGYRDKVYVSPEYCSSCANDGRAWGNDAFNSIKSAIDSGAQRVQLMPGIYREPFFFPHTVQVEGSGADSTILLSPAGSTRALASAEGTTDMSLSRVTLAGASGNAVEVADGARNLSLKRSIVRGNGRGVQTWGGTGIDVVNNTFAGNAVAIGADAASVNARNNIFYNASDVAVWSFNSSTVVRTYNDYFGNANDLRVQFANQAANGLGEITQDPLFLAPPANDFRPTATSPVLNAGDPADGSAPGNGGRVDMGYIESGVGTFYVRPSYCQGCANDGLSFGVDAFNTIQAAVNAAKDYLANVACVDQGTGACTERATVSVGPGTYNDNVVLPSYITLLGSGASTGAKLTHIAGGGGAAVTFSGAMHTRIGGFRLSGNPGGGGAVAVLSNSGNITIANNVILPGASASGVRVQSNARAAVAFNTIVGGAAGVTASGAKVAAAVRNNIVSGAATGLDAASSGVIENAYNLLFNTANYGGSAVAGDGEIAGQDPLFTNSGSGDYTLQPASPAVDAADPLLDPISGGGEQRDMGYRELTATPLILLFGKQGDACVIANSGVKQVEVGVSAAVAGTPVSSTLPGAWNLATLAQPGAIATYWTRAVMPGGPGLNRLYSRATDMLDNTEKPQTAYADAFGRALAAPKFNLYDGAVRVDATPPTVTLVAPTDGLTTTESGFLLQGTADDDGGTGNVRTVFFLVDGNRVEATWTPGWSGLGPRPFQATASLAQGGRTLRAGARDVVGNQGLSAAATITIVAPPNEPFPYSTNVVLSVATPVNGATTNKSSLPVAGSVNSNGSGYTYLQGLAQRHEYDYNWFYPSVTDPFVQTTSWQGAVNLTFDGQYTLTVTGSRGGDNDTKVLTITKDSTPPTVTVPANVITTRTVVLTGTAVDATSGIAKVEVSLDGGVTWEPAMVGPSGPGTPATWSFVWTAPTDENQTYPVLVRATDGAGNSSATVATGVTVDTLPPTAPPDVWFDSPPGTYFTGPATLLITWTAPTDPGGGPVKTYIKIDQISTTQGVSATQGVSPTPGTSLTVPITDDGEWYVHITHEDGPGNTTTTTYGPWHRQSTQLCFAPDAGVVIDGVINDALGEWPSGAHMDDDDRPLLQKATTIASDRILRGRQSLFATWDQNAFYVAWRGAAWGGSALWLYFSAGGAGTSTPISQTVPASVLPFDADVAVVVDGPDSARLYTYVGGAWTLTGGLMTGQAGLDETELRIPMLPAAMVALGVEASGEVFASFPTTNPLGGALADAYEWSPLCAAPAPNAGQPRATLVTFDLASPQPTSALYAPGGGLQYVVTARNYSARSVSGAQVSVTTTAGQGFAALDGPPGVTCAACPPNGTAWLLSYAPIAPESSVQFTLTGALEANLSSVDKVTATVRASAAGTVFASPSASPIAALSRAASLAPQDRLAARAAAAAQSSVVLSITHLVDGQAPVITPTLPNGAAIQPGLRPIDGLADDGSGSGVVRVEVRPVGEALWQVMSGTNVWTGQVNVPATTEFVVEARAIDGFDQVSASKFVTYIVDAVYPTVTMQIPVSITSQFVQLFGDALDPYPAGGLVEKVELQFGATGNWDDVTGLYAPDPGNNNARQWSFTWPVPLTDRLEILVRPRATDSAGNVTIGEWRTVLVDRLGPAISVTTNLTKVLPGSVDVVLNGTITDASGIDEFYVLAVRHDGQVFTLPLAIDSGQWGFTPELLPIGDYGLMVVGKDGMGNTTQRFTFPLAVQPPYAACGDVAEPDDTPGTAKPITIGVTETRRLCAAGDLDWVYFDAVAGTTYRIETFNLQGGADTRIALIGADGSSVMGLDDNGNGGAASRLVTVLNNGRHYIRVSNSSFTGSSAMRYDLRVTAEKAGRYYFVPNTNRQRTAGW